jgi:hypothetical protein
MFDDITALGADYSASQAHEGVTGALADVAAPLAMQKAVVPPSPFKLPKGEWFDEDFDFIGPEGDAFTEAVLERVAATEVRTRKRKAIDVPNHRLLVRKLAVNCFRALHWFDPPLVAVQVGPDAYKERGGSYLNGDAMRREIDNLQKGGLIEISNGVWGEVSTTLRPTAAFAATAMNAALTEHNVTHRLATERLIRVYRTNSEDGELIDFEQDDQTRDWTERCDAYNRFLATQDIGIDGLSRAETAQLIARQTACRQTGTPRLKRPDLSNKSLFRQFNNGGFEAGGRFYGAWWVNCPSDLRPLITIGGEPTVELDYSSCAIRMLYHKNNMTFEGDAFFIEALHACQQANGLRERHFRKGTKRLANALFNTTKDGRPGAVKLTGQENVRPWFKEAEVLAMLRVKHAPIAHEFQSEAWTWLQREDSEIALTVITNLMNKGVVALPIHDSFVVIDGEEEALKQEMNACYLKKFGFYPEIE